LLEIANFPVKFPVGREIAWRLVRIKFVASQTISAPRKSFSTVQRLADFAGEFADASLAQKTKPLLQ
jgi:hypothetical protein